MNILFWAITLGTIGKIMIALAVLGAHNKLAEERRIDKQVIAGFHTEKLITVAGVVFILLGYALEIYFYGFTTSFLSCSGVECTGAVSNAFQQ